VLMPLFSPTLVEDGQGEAGGSAIAGRLSEAAGRAADQGPQLDEDEDEAVPLPFGHMRGVAVWPPFGPVRGNLRALSPSGRCEGANRACATVASVSAVSLYSRWPESNMHSGPPFSPY